MTEIISAILGFIAGAATITIAIKFDFINISFLKTETLVNSKNKDVTKFKKMKIEKVIFEADSVLTESKTDENDEPIEISLREINKARVLLIVTLTICRTQQGGILPEQVGELRNLLQYRLHILSAEEMENYEVMLAGAADRNTFNETLKIISKVNNEEAALIEQKRENKK